MFDSMDAENPEVYVVIAKSDLRPADQRPFEVHEHECCALKVNDHHVFVIPKDYGVSKHAIIPKQFVSKDYPTQGVDLKLSEVVGAMSPAEAIEFQKATWGGSDPLAFFSLEAASLVSQRLLDKWFVMLSPKSIDMRIPQVGYLLELNEWYWMQLSVLHHSKVLNAAASRIADTHRHHLCRALRIGVPGRGKGVTVEPRIVDLGKYKDLQPLMIRVGTWQRRLWEKTAARIPNSAVGEKLETGCPRKSRVWDGECEQADMNDKRGLYLMLMFTYWKQRGLPYKSMAQDLAEAFGRDAIEKGNMKNLLGRHGLEPPSPQVLREIFTKLKNEVRGMEPSSEDNGLHVWSSMNDYGAMTRRLLGVALPEPTGRMILAEMAVPICPMAVSRTPSRW